MENTHTNKINGWSSFSHTTTTTIIFTTIAYSSYLFLEQLSTRFGTTGTSSTLARLAAASPSQDFITLLKAFIFVGLFPTMLWIRYLIRNSDERPIRNWNLFGADYSGVSFFMGLFVGGLLFLCVRFTIQSMLFA